MAAEIKGVKRGTPFVPRRCRVTLLTATYGSARPCYLPPMSLSNTVSIVTGGSSGIGLATARALASAGSRVALCSRSAHNVRAAVAELATEGLTVTGEVCDVRDRKAVHDFFALIRRDLGPVDILVNNAGLAHFRPLQGLTDREIDDMLDINVRGMFNITRAALVPMLEQGRGQIVNIASLAGRTGFAGGTAYSASKHAVLGFSRSLMLEVRDRGIRVIAICPGSVATGFFESAGMPLDNEDRILRPEDVAEAVLGCLTLPDRALISELDIRPSSP